MPSEIENLAKEVLAESKEFITTLSGEQALVVSNSINDLSLLYSRLVLNPADETQIKQDIAHVMNSLKSHAALAGFRAEMQVKLAFTKVITKITQIAVAALIAV